MPSTAPTIDLVTDLVTHGPDPAPTEGTARQSSNTRRCSACRQTKPVDEYAFKNKTRGLRISKCRPCVATYNREYHATNRARLNPKAHRSSRAQRAVLVDLADTIRHAATCGSCGRDRVRGADIVLLPPKNLTAGRPLSEVVRACWSTERFSALLEATVADPAGVRCRGCLGRETGLARQTELRASRTPS